MSSMPPPRPGPRGREPDGDVELVLRAREGDRAAWGALYARYADRLFDYATRLTGSRAQAADCVQDSFVLAVERLGQLRDPEKVRPWLYAIVRSTAHRHYRQANRFSLQDVPEVADAGDDVMVRGVTDQELAALIEEAAAGLTDEDREVLDLSLRHDMSPADVAAALGVSSRHAAVTTERMRERLGRSVVVTVLSRKPECAELAQLKRTEGELTPLVRKRLARHIDGCDVCAAQRDRQVRPEALLGVLPLLLLPKRAFADFEERLDEALRRMHAGAPPTDGGMAWGSDGFPSVRRGRRARWLPWAAAALVGVGAAGGVALVVRDDARGTISASAEATDASGAPPGITPPVSDPDPTAPVAETATPSIDERFVEDTVGGAERALLPPSSPPTSAPATTIPPTTAAVLPTTPRPAPSTSRPPTTQPLSSLPPSTAVATVPPTAPPELPPTAPPATAPPPTAAPTTEAPATTAAPTTAPPDVAGPAVAGGTPAASTISVQDNPYCAEPKTTTYVISVSDPAGVQSVTFTWSAGGAAGSGAFAPTGGRWQATLGPVFAAAVPVGSGTDGVAPMNLTISARDSLGNVTTAGRPGAVTVRNCYVIL